MKLEQLITNPKKSIIGLSIPMILSLFLTMINNLADAMWVSGLGSDALAAIGIVTPLFIIIIGLESVYQQVSIQQLRVLSERET